MCTRQRRVTAIVECDDVSTQGYARIKMNELCSNVKQWNVQ